MKRHLADKGVPYRVNQVPNSPRWQMFLRDPKSYRRILVTDWVRRQRFELAI